MKRVVIAVFIVMTAFLSMQKIAFAQVSGIRDLPVFYTAGSSMAITLDFEVDEANAPNAVIIKEYIPIGWELTLTTPTYNNFDAATGEIKWLFYGSDVTDEDMDVSYEVNVPADESGLITFTGQALFNDLLGDPITSDIGDFSLTVSDVVDAFVTRFYRQCLARDPDLGGLNYWVNSLKNRTRTGADVAKGFIFSKEFTNANVLDKVYLDILYEAFFNRQSDPGGYKHWFDKLKDNVDRAEVLDGFIFSVEFDNLCYLYNISPNNVNDAPTDITLSHSAVAENQPIGTTVGSLSTIDPDIGNTFTYSLANGDGSRDNGSFIIQGDKLKTLESFNYEAKSSYSLRVRSTDQEGLFVEKIFTVEVTNVNEAPVVDTQIMEPVAENSATGTIVGSLTVSDPDVGQNESHSITAGNTNDAFAIDTIGLITVANSTALDFEITPTFILTVQVTDDGSPALSDTATVTINLINVVEQTPVITGISEDRDVASDGITTDRTLLIHGTAEPGMSVTVSRDASGIGTTTADAFGMWTLDDTGTSLADGTYELTAIAKDSLGSQSEASASYTVTVEADARISAFVTRFYWQCLKRKPDSGGLSYWVGHLTGGSKTGSDVAFGFVFSDEFKNSDTSNEEYLTVLYLAFFEREPDKDGFDYWLDLLDSGASREDVLNGYIYAQEFYNLCDEYGITPN